MTIHGVDQFLGLTEGVTGQAGRMALQTHSPRVAGLEEPAQFETPVDPARPGLPAPWDVSDLYVANSVDRSLQDVLRRIAHQMPVIKVIEKAQ